MTTKRIGMFFLHISLLYWVAWLAMSRWEYEPLENLFLYLEGLDGAEKTVGTEKVAG